MRKSPLVKALRDFWDDESAQTLTEYTILTVYIALFMVAFFKDVGLLMKGVWVVTNQDLTAANTSAS